MSRYVSSNILFEPDAQTDTDATDIEEAVNSANGGVMNSCRKSTYDKQKQKPRHHGARIDSRYCVRFAIDCKSRMTYAGVDACKSFVESA